jgi:Dyp-type peroxidase family
VQVVRLVVGRMWGGKLMKQSCAQPCATHGMRALYGWTRSFSSFKDPSLAQPCTCARAELNSSDPNSNTTTNASEPLSCSLQKGTKKRLATASPLVSPNLSSHPAPAALADEPSFPPHALHPTQYLVPLNSFSPVAQTERRAKGPARTPSMVNEDPTRVPPPGLTGDDKAELDVVFNLENIQGDVLAGFNKPYFLAVGLQIANVAAVKDWMKTTVFPNLTNTLMVMNDRDKFRQLRMQTGTKVGAISTLVQENETNPYFNISISAQGMTTLGVPTGDFTDGNFQTDLDGLVSTFGDPPASGWKFGGPSNHLDILVQFAADTEALLTQIRTKVLGNFATQPGGNGILTNIYEESGFRNPSLPGHEQFGFLDGIGQPAFKGVYVDKLGQKVYFSPRSITHTDSRWNMYSDPGISLVWPGEFVFGYPTPDFLRPNQPSKKTGGVDPAFGTYPEWAKDGSMVAFRRLQQDVPTFWNFLKTQNANNTTLPKGMSDDELGSRFIGRWPSGTPVMRSTDKDLPIMGDQSLSNSNFLFSFAVSPPVPLIAYGNKPDGYPQAPADPSGFHCPIAGHIRKVNPRDSADDNPLRHRIIRRGSPYGAFIRDRYTPDGVDRGLLFIAYQASLGQGIVFLQSMWANAQSAPNVGGHDMIIGQPQGDRSFTLPIASDPNNPGQITTPLRWVTMTGGGFFFVPPLSFFNPNSPTSPLYK